MVQLARKLMRAATLSNTIPAKPNSSSKKYQCTELAKNYLKIILTTGAITFGTSAGTSSTFRNPLLALLLINPNYFKVKQWHQ
jgi:hypothetical protein